MSNWFTTDKDGLRQISERNVERRGFGLIGAELWQNVMDTDATECHITLEKLPGRPAAELRCIDNGHGFHDLAHAWTMFAPSEKKHDPTKAGRFNMGEKMVLSFCREARIFTTSGTVLFDGKGRTEKPRVKRDSGTEFFAIIDCTTQRYDQFIEYMSRIIVSPERGIKLIVNGDVIEPRKPIHTFEYTLPTEIGEDLRPSQRKTQVLLYEPLAGETPSIYELGIPVVETDDKWHVCVMQKVPLNVDRDNVTPAYLKKVRVGVLNEMHAKLTAEDTTTAWVNDAADNKECTNEAAETFRVQRYGAKSVAFDPSDPEANNRAMAAGFTVIPSRGLSSGQRENLYRAGTLTPSGRLFPTHKPYSDDPTAPEVQVVPRAKWSKGMEIIHRYSETIGAKITDGSVTVRFVNTHNHFAACCGLDRVLDYNIRKLGRAWFDLTNSTLADAFWAKVDRLLIHELAHVKVSNHLSDDFHEECCRLGARIKRLALNEPTLFKKFESEMFEV